MTPITNHQSPITAFGTMKISIVGTGYVGLSNAILADVDAKVITRDLFGSD